MGYPKFYGQAVDLAEMLAGAEDLDEVGRAYAREVAIREGMASTGESREVVAGAIDVMELRDQEMVLDLTEGQPTTLVDALSQYVEVLAGRDEIVPRDRITGELDAIVRYPWPAEEAVIATHDLNRTLRLNVLHDEKMITVSLGSTNPVTIWAEEYYSEFTLGKIRDYATAIHGAVLARVVGDRDHHVQISSTDRRSLLAWLEHPSGSWSPDGERRLTVDAVEGGGIIVRTRPYRFTPPQNQA